MTAPQHQPHSLRVADLPQRRATRFDLEPTAQEMAGIAADLGLDGLRKLRLTGEVRPSGKADWHLEARLGATVMQPCVATLAPVTTRIEEPVVRRFLSDMPLAEEFDGEVEMTEDDSIEPLGPVIDLWAVMCEALTLALPLYPRAEDAPQARDTVVSEAGVDPLKDEDLKPFAGLADLKKKLENGEGNG